MRKWENENRVGFSFERGKLIMVSMIRLSFLIIIILCLFQTTLNLSFSVSQFLCFFCANIHDCYLNCLPLHKNYKKQDE